MTERAAMESSELECVGWPAPVLDVVSAVASSWRLSLGLGVLIVCGVGAWTFVADPYYTSSAVAVLMPREKPALDVSVRAGSIETAEDSARRSDTGSLMLPPQPGLYMELLTSDRVMASIAERFRAQLDRRREDLKTVELVSMLRRMVKIVGTEEGLLTVEVTARTGQLAADLANAFLADGETTSRVIEQQLLGEQVHHLAEAIARVRAELEVEERDLSEFYASQQLIDPMRESSETLRQIRETNMLRDGLVRDLAERRVSYTESESSVQRLVAQIDNANGRIRQLQSRIVGVADRISYGALLVEHERIQQRVRANRDLLQTLGTQYNVYRVRAEQPNGSLVTIKPATTPTSPAGPRKKRMLGVALAAGLILGVAVAILRRQWVRALSDERTAAQLADIKARLFCRSAQPSPVS